MSEPIYCPDIGPWAAQRPKDAALHAAEDWFSKHDPTPEPLIEEMIKVHLAKQRQSEAEELRKRLREEFIETVNRARRLKAFMEWLEKHPEAVDNLKIFAQLSNKP